jgi:hypothetical protein
MAVLYGREMTKLRVDPITVPDPGSVDATVKCFHEVVTYATQTTSDTIEVARLPKGASFLYGVLNTSVTTATATVAIGITGTTGKYRAAAAKTTTVPEVFGLTAGQSAVTADEEIVFITIGTASLPASGTMTVDLYYTYH